MHGKKPRRGHTAGKRGAEFFIFHRALGGLREDIHGAVQVDLPGSYGLLQLEQVLHHARISIHLAHQPQHLGVAYLSENDYLAILLGGTRLAYALLYLQHHRAGEIHHLPAHLLRNPVCLGRLSVGTDQQGPAVPLHRLEGVHRAQAFFPEPPQLRLIMDDGPKRKQRTALGKKLLRAIYGPDDSAAEARIPVNLDSHQSRIPNFPWMRPWIQTSSS